MMFYWLMNNKMRAHVVASELYSYLIRVLQYHYYFAICFFLLITFLSVLPPPIINFETGF